MEEEWLDVQAAEEVGAKEQRADATHGLASAGPTAHSTVHSCPSEDALHSCVHSQGLGGFLGEMRVLDWSISAFTPAHSPTPPFKKSFSSHCPEVWKGVFYQTKSMDEECIPFSFTSQETVGLILSSHKISKVHADGSQVHKCLSGGLLKCWRWHLCLPSPGRQDCRVPGRQLNIQLNIQ